MYIYDGIFYKNCLLHQIKKITCLIVPRGQISIVMKAFEHANWHFITICGTGFNKRSCYVS